MEKGQARKRSKTVKRPARKTRRSGNHPKPSEDIQPAGSGDATDPSSGTTFAFSVAQLKYLMALREAADEGRPTSDRALSEELKMSRTTLWEWRHDPAFTAWLREELKTESDTRFELAVARQTSLAIRGSVRSFEAVVRLRAIAAKIGIENAHQSTENAPYIVNLLCPRPPSNGEKS